MRSQYVSVRVLLLVVLIALRSAADVYACSRDTETQVLGVPVWATDPNEGDTFGAMPILMDVCPDDHHTNWLFAPSVTYNSLIHYTGTLRFFAYPERDKTLQVIASMSTETNYNFWASWQSLPTAQFALTDESLAKATRTLFTRFWGMGAHSMASAETSYTMERAFVSDRRGINLGNDFNVGLTGGIEYDHALDEGIPNLALAPEMFPTVPGMQDASFVMWQGVDVRYDNRVGGDFAEQGVRADAWAQVVEGLMGAPVFGKAGAQVNGLWKETDRLGGGARVMWTGTSDASAPFYDQSTLGGAFVLRGFGEGRFVDRMAWEIETEQRIKLLTTHFFGVTTDWRADPFIAAGQVFGNWNAAFEKPQLAAGVGLRAFVRPTILGRLDVAAGGEGAKVYVEIGYPY